MIKHTCLFVTLIQCITITIHYTKKKKENLCEQLFNRIMLFNYEMVVKNIQQKIYEYEQ